MGALAAPLLIASTGASVGMSVLGGVHAQAAGKAEAKQLKVAKRDEAIAGRQRAVAIQRNLRQTLSGQRALMASRGLDLGDRGTPAAIAGATERAAGTDLLTNQVNTDSRLRALTFQAQQAKQQGDAAFLSGIVNGLSSAAGGAFMMHQIGGFGGGSGAPAGAGVRSPFATTSRPAFGGRSTFGRSLFVGTD